MRGKPDEKPLQGRGPVDHEKLPLLSCDELLKDPVKPGGEWLNADEIHMPDFQGQWKISVLLLMHEHECPRDGSAELPAHRQDRLAAGYRVFRCKKKTGQLLRGCKRTLQRWFRKIRSIAAIPVR